MQFLILVLLLFFPWFSGFVPNDSVSLSTWHPFPRSVYQPAGVSRGIVFKPVDKNDIPNPVAGELVLDTYGKFYHYSSANTWETALGGGGLTCTDFPVSAYISSPNTRTVLNFAQPRVCMSGYSIF